jgi:hypothetical protein
MARETTRKKSRAKVKDETESPYPRQTAKQRYEQLVPVRQPYLDRARDASALTIPSLMPPDGANSNTNLYTPFQSVGADGVNNISAKLMLSLFPPGNPFFRLALDDFVLAELKQKSGEEFDDARAEFEEVLGQIERAVVNRMEVRGNRPVLFEAFKHDIVCGNFLLQTLKGGKLKMFPLDRFVVKRDQEGSPLEIIAKEVLSRMTLPPEVEAIVAVHEIEYPQDKDSTQRDRVELFTHVKRYDSSWAVYQEVCGKIIKGTEGTYPLDNSVWIPVRWTSIAGEDYGRGLIEEYIGDLNSLEALSQSIVEFSAAASKILFMVNDSGITDRRQLARAASGDFVDGDAKDVTTLQLEKGQDFSVANTVADRIEKRLERAFLLLSGVQRDAERVTAEEIRTIVAELEAKHAGSYSVLAQELQLPLAKRVMLDMQKEKALPHLPVDPCRATDRHRSGWSGPHE